MQPVKTSRNMHGLGRCIFAECLCENGVVLIILKRPLNQGSDARAWKWGTFNKRQRLILESGILNTDIRIGHQKSVLGCEILT